MVKLQCLHFLQKFSSKIMTAEVILLCCISALYCCVKDTNFHRPVLSQSDKMADEMQLKLYNSDYHSACFALPQFAKSVSDWIIFTVRIEIFVTKIGAWLQLFLLQDEFSYIVTKFGSIISHRCNVGVILLNRFISYAITHCKMLVIHTVIILFSVYS